MVVLDPVQIPCHILHCSLGTILTALKHPESEGVIPIRVQNYFVFIEISLEQFEFLVLWFRI